MVALILSTLNYLARTAGGRDGLNLATQNVCCRLVTFLGCTECDSGGSGILEDVITAATRQRILRSVVRSAVLLFS